MRFYFTFIVGLLFASPSFSQAPAYLGCVRQQAENQRRLDYPNDLIPIIAKQILSQCDDMLMRYDYDDIINAYRISQEMQRSNHLDVAKVILLARQEIRIIAENYAIARLRK